MPEQLIKDWECLRQESLEKLQVLDTEPEEAFDSLVTIAADICDSPISLLTLVDEHRQWFKANQGLEGVTETPRNVAFCNHAIESDLIMEINDATKDPRFASNPLVTGAPDIRFYAGAPLCLTDGSRVGTLCVIDQRPRELDDRQRHLLANLARIAVQSLEGRRALMAEQCLRMNAEKLYAAVHNSRDAIVVVDKRNEITDWNPAAEVLFGFSAGEMLGQNLKRVLFNDRSRECITPLELHKQYPQGRTYETVYSGSNGECIDVSVSSTPILNADSKVIGATKIFRDIRLQQQRAKSLEASEARYRALYKSTPAMLQSIDTSGNLISVSDKWLSTLGYTEDEVLGRPTTDFLHQQSGQPLSRVLADFFRAGVSKDMEHRMICKSGEIIDVLVSAVPECDATGAPVLSLAAITDVTLRRKAEKKLSKEYQRRGAIIEGTGAGTWEWNIQSGELRFNDRWAHIIGYSESELENFTQANWQERTHPVDLLKSEALLAKHLSGEVDLYECETRVKHRDGQWVWVLDRGRVLTRTNNNLPEWMYGTRIDISERKKQESTFARSEQLLNRTGEVAGIGGWELNLLNNALIWSGQTRHIYGVDDNYHPTIESAIDFFAPESRSLIHEAVDKAIKTGTGFDLELQFDQAGGQRIWVRAVGQAEFEGGKPIRLMGALQDVTEQVEQRQALESAHQRLSLATDSGRIGVWDFDVANERLDWDEHMYQLYGLDPSAASMDYALWMMYLHPDDRRHVERQLHSALSGVAEFDTEFRIVIDDGSERYTRATAKVTRDTHGKALRMIGANWDVTPLRILSGKLDDERELLQVTLSSIGDGVITASAEGKVTWLNPVAERLTGWSVEEAQDRSLGEVFYIVNQDTRLPAVNPVKQCITEGKIVGLAKDTVLIARDRTEYGIEDSAAPITNANGEMLGVVLVFHDVTEQRRLSSEISYRASHDALTGIINRSEFERCLQSVLMNTRQNHQSHVFMFIDLDKFKLVNDSCGHAAGDKLLQQFTSMLQSIVRKDDTLARLGGDEFAVLLENCSTDEALRVGEQICQRMDAFRFVHNEKRFRVGASVGLVCFDESWDSMAAIVQAADSACYEAKVNGRNRVHVWVETDTTINARRGETYWAQRLEQAIDESRFELYAQRLYELKSTGQSLRAEVLLRLKDDDGLIVLPNEFLPAAERYHLMSRIDRWVLAESIELLASLPSLSCIDRLSINLSGQSMGDRAFLNEVVRLLSLAGSEVCHCVCLEITETTAISHPEDANAFIGELHALGVLVALDDFGSGNASFGYLKSLSVDILKIDGQFIQNLVDDPLDAATVRCFVDVAKVIDVQTVAEFVDSSVVLERLKEIDVDAAQGFCLHKPEPIEQVLDQATAEFLDIA